MQFSEKFSIIQKELKLSQKDFAAKIELSPNTISQYLTSKRKPDIHTIQKLVDIGVSPLFLFANAQMPFDATYDKFVEARLKYGDEELTEIIENYLERKKMEKFDRINGTVMKINDELSDVKMSAEKRKTITGLTSELLKKLEKQDEKLSEMQRRLKP